MGNKEIEAMLDSLEGEIKTDAPTTDAPDIKTDPPSTDAPIVDDDDEFETDQPETDAPTTDAPETDLDRFKRENEELRAKIDELSAPKTKAPTTEAPSTDAPIETKDFIKDIDLDDLSDDPAKLNEILNLIYKEAVQAARTELRTFSQSTLQRVPELIDSTLTTKEKLKALTDDFYKSNEDLAGFKKTVGVVFGELASENPDKNYDEVLKMTGEETRKRLGLKKGKANPKPKNDDDPPPLPRKRGTRNKPEPKKSSALQSQIEEMNKTLTG